MGSPKALALELNIAPSNPMPSTRASAGAEKRPGVLAGACFRRKGTAERRRIGAMFNSSASAESNSKLIKSFFSGQAAS